MQYIPLHKSNRMSICLSVPKVLTNCRSDMVFPKYPLENPLYFSLPFLKFKIENWLRLTSIPTQVFINKELTVIKVYHCTLHIKLVNKCSFILVTIKNFDETKKNNKMSFFTFGGLFAFFLH